MDKEEFIEFSTEELQTIREGIVEEAFEIKQYAIQKPPIVKMFNRKLKRLSDLIDIQQDLFPEDVVEKGDSISLLPYNQELLEDLFTTYFSNKSKLKQRMFASQSLSEVYAIMEEMCANEKEFGSVFNFLEEDESIIVSKEPDPMRIHELIKEIAESQTITIDKIKNSTNILPIELLNEMKRLFLLFKKY
jgi:hypothetical protein